MVKLISIRGEQLSGGKEEQNVQANSRESLESKCVVQAKLREIPDGPHAPWARGLGALTAMVCVRTLAATQTRAPSSRSRRLSCTHELFHYCKHLHYLLSTDQ